MSDNKYTSVIPTLVPIISNGHCVLVISPKTKTIRVMFRDMNENDLNPTELETLDVYITQYELIGYVLALPIEC